MQSDPSTRPLNEDVKLEVVPRHKSVDALGEFSDVYKGDFKSTNDSCSSQKVAIKVMRGLSAADKAAQNTFVSGICEAVRAWKGLNHQNVLKILGIATVPFGLMPALITPWMENGSIVEYVHRVYPAEIEPILGLMSSVAAGLAYLHENNVVHGDLRGANILVDVNGEPKIADFELSGLISSFAFTSPTVAGPCRWMAIELLTADDAASSTATKESDIWSFSMTLLEVVTGNKPYAHIRHDTLVILQVVRGTLPQQPEILQPYPDLWDLVLQCWDGAPGHRSAAFAKLHQKLSLFQEAEIIEKHSSDGRQEDEGYSISSPLLWWPLPLLWSILPRFIRSTPAPISHKKSPERRG